MTLLEAITEAQLLAQGKDTPPSSTSSKYSAFKGFANVVQRMWAAEKDAEWDSLGFTATISGVTATDTFILPNTVRTVSKDPDNKIYIVHPDDNKTYYDLVAPSELQAYAKAGMRVVAKKGSTVVFSLPFKAPDPQFGGEIKVPSFSFVAKLIANEDELEVDDPLWATQMMAAEYCRTKTSLQYRVDGLVERATEIMADMKENQGGSTMRVKRDSLVRGGI